jgi:4-carboxymuconolactone decarboxylase
MTSEAFKKGEQVRREVLGAERVNATMKDPNDFAYTMMETCTEFAWGQIWTRPAIDRRTRSFMTLAMLAALNRPHEIAVHVRGALNNGLTREEIKEIFLHVLPYCGAPAAIDATGVAKQVFAEIDAKK